MSSHNESEHICSVECVDYVDSTIDFTLTIVIYEDSNILINEWYKLFNGVLFGLLGDNVISGEEITVKINNARILAKVITKLNNDFSNDFAIDSYEFNSRGNNLTVILGEC